MATLRSYVHIAGAIYGPGDKIPAEVAKRITNEKAWGVPSGSSDDSSGDGSYSDLKVVDLKAEIESRNEGRDEDALISLDGVKADLVAALETDDATA